MKKILKLALLMPLMTFVSFALVSCGSDSDDALDNLSEDEKVQLGTWYGVYVDENDDCSYITLDVKPDKTFTYNVESEYGGRDGSGMWNYRGQYSWDFTAKISDEFNWIISGYYLQHICDNSARYPSLFGEDVFHHADYAKKIVTFSRMKSWEKGMTQKELVLFEKLNNGREWRGRIDFDQYDISLVFRRDGKYYEIFNSGEYEITFGKWNIVGNTIILSGDDTAITNAHGSSFTIVSCTYDQSVNYYKLQLRDQFGDILTFMDRG